ncbi:MAG: aminotransferase class III-fold pyridoxal phosphate-dependent enzyme, partial [Halioglobus sp.]|nr:aminotransferase class III-fold pyridoxal phosphate-dependent enzyme [Halioglobus sp.]
QAGTLSGNPLAMAAGLATLTELERAGFYPALEETCRQLVDGLTEIAAREGVPLACEHAGGMFGIVFTDTAPVRSYAQVAAANTGRFRRFFHGMLERNVYFAPSAFEAGFVSAAHGEREISKTLEAAREVMPTLT